jgi:hypothetical protein
LWLLIGVSEINIASLVRFFPMGFFLVHIGYTSHGYVQMSWTLTYHITVPTARREQQMI